MKEAKNYTIRVLGDTYTIASNEPADRVHTSALLVDKMMQEITQSAPIDQKRAAVLVALRMATQLSALQESVAISEREQKRIIKLLDEWLLTKHI